ncbi:MAG: hypothetical protein JWO03_49 [Bacteroidetes bacterium]|nr:hypothetical protein [Bacteroidota bacterium]
MKKLLITCSAIFMVLSSFAQTVSHLRAVRDDRYNIPSSSWYYIDSDLYQYNSLLQDTTIQVYAYSQNTWKLRARIFSNFATNGKMADYEYFFMDTLTGLVSSGYLKYNFGYNAQDDTTSILIQHWDVPTSNWLNNGRIYFYPDANHRDTASITQLYTSGTWQNSKYVTSTFNAAGLIINQTTNTWNGSAYDPTSKIRYSYDANNHLVARIDQIWDGGASAWVNAKEYIYTWNSSDDNTQREHRLWNSGTSTWDNDSMFYQTFNGTHHVVNQLSQAYNSGTSSYVNKSQTNYARDVRDNVTLLENDYWSASQWQHDERYTYIYNQFDQVIDEVHDDYNSSISMYQSYKRKHNYYDEISTGVAAIPASAIISLYPNPVNSNSVHIIFDNARAGDVSVSIYDLRGRMLSQENRMAAAGANDLAIDISALSAGQYLVSITAADGHKLSATKMIKQ